jgi:hypothetical protein
VTVVKSFDGHHEHPTQQKPVSSHSRQILDRQHRYLVHGKIWTQRASRSPKFDFLQEKTRDTFFITCLHSALVTYEPNQTFQDRSDQIGPRLQVRRPTSNTWPTTARAWGTRVILAICSTEEREQNSKVFGRLRHRGKCDWPTTARVPRRLVIASCNAKTHKTGANFKERQLGVVQRGIWPMTARARWYVLRSPRVRNKQRSGPSFWTVTRASIPAMWRHTKIFRPLTSCQ